MDSGASRDAEVDSVPLSSERFHTRFSVIEESKMALGELARRDILLVVGGLGVGLLTESASAQEPVPTIDPSTLGAYHADMMDRLARALGSSRLVSREGLLKIIAVLPDYQMSNKDKGRDILRRVVDTVSGAKNDIQDLRTKLMELAKEAHDAKELVVETVANIAISSIDYVLRRTKDIPISEVVMIAMEDLAGALTGWEACSKFVNPMFAALGALGGAVAKSFVATRS